MSDEKATRAAEAGQSGGLDFQALRRKAAHGLHQRLYEGYGDQQRDADGRPYRVQIPPLIEGGRGPDTLRQLADRWVGGPFPEGRYQALQIQGYDLRLSPGDRMVIFHRAALREGVGERIRTRQSVKPFRNAITEEADELVRGPRRSWEQPEPTEELERLEEPPRRPDGVPAPLTEFWERELLSREAEPREEQVWRLRQRGYAYEEIAGFLGISVGRVGECLSKVRHKLRRAVDQGY